MRKCKKCNKLLKENTEGNNKYCQGHSIFDTIKNEGGAKNEKNIPNYM